MTRRATTHIAAGMARAWCNRSLDQVDRFGYSDEYRQWYSDPDRDTTLRWCAACTERYWQQRLRQAHRPDEETE